MTNTLPTSLKIAIVSGILHPKYGGPAAVIHAQAKELASQANINIFGVAKPDEFDDVKKLFPGSHIFPRVYPNRWFRGKGLKKALAEYVNEFDVIHVHILWEYSLFASWLATRTTRKPIVLTLHGSVLDPWRVSSIHKRMYRYLVLNRILPDITFIHALTRTEALSCNKFGINIPIRIIPNGLPKSEFECFIGPEIAYDQWPELRNRRILLFLGRLWHQKGLDLLIKSWSRIIRGTGNKGWLLVIAGPDYRGYESHLRNLITSLSIEKNVLLTGYVGGPLKRSLLEASECFVLPSFSESFSMSILEAMAAGLPVLYTKNCNFPELAANGGGWEVEFGEKILLKELIKIVSQDPITLAEVGKKGNRFGVNNYTLEHVALKLMELYHDAIKLHNQTNQ